MNRYRTATVLLLCVCGCRAGEGSAPVDAQLAAAAMGSAAGVLGPDEGGPGLEPPGLTGNLQNEADPATDERPGMETAQGAAGAGLGDMMGSAQAGAGVPGGAAPQPPGVAGTGSAQPGDTDADGTRQSCDDLRSCDALDPCPDDALSCILVPTCAGAVCATPSDACQLECGVPNCALLESHPAQVRCEG